MAIEHLTDTQLQDYLDGNLAGGEREILVHLNTCQSCRSRLKQYELLYGELGQDNIPTLSPGFSRAVISRIIPVKAPAKSKLTATLILSILGILGSLGSLIYFVNPTTLIRSFQMEWLADYLEKVVVDSADKAAGSLNIDMTYVILTALTLIIIAAIDYIVRHHKYRTATFLA